MPMHVKKSIVASNTDLDFIDDEDEVDQPHGNDESDFIVMDSQNTLPPRAV